MEWHLTARWRRSVAMSGVGEMRRDAAEVRWLGEGWRPLPHPSIHRRQHRTAQHGGTQKLLGQQSEKKRGSREGRGS